MIVFFYTENEGNGKSLFGRKRKSRSNYCSFPRKLYTDKEIKIGAHSPREERKSMTSTQEDKMIYWKSNI